MSTFETDFFRKALKDGLISVGGNSVVLTRVVPADGAYVAGDALGGYFHWPDAMREPGATAVLQSLMVLDASDQKSPLTIFLFSQAPVGGYYADGEAATDLGDDAAFLRAVVQVAAEDYTTVAGVAVASVSGIGALLDAGTTNLWMVVVSGGTPTYVTGTLRITMGLLRD